MAPIWGLDERVSQLRLRGIPVVLLDRASNASDFCSVSVDDVEGGRLAAEHLLDQGHTKIALIGGPGNLQQVRDRRLGAELASSRHDGAAQLPVISTQHLDVESGIRAAEEISVTRRSGSPDCGIPQQMTYWQIGFAARFCDGRVARTRRHGNCGVRRHCLCRSSRRPVVVGPATSTGVSAIGRRSCYLTKLKRMSGTRRMSMSRCDLHQSW